MNARKSAQQLIGILGRGTKNGCCSNLADLGSSNAQYSFTPRISNSTSVDEPEYAFEMICSTIRFGAGVTREIGDDLKSLGVQKTMVLTDPELMDKHAFKTVVDTLIKMKCNYSVYSQVHVEPTDTSFKKAIEFARAGRFDSFIAVGGGSTMDTAKAASLLAANKDNDLMDYVVAPFGKSMTPAKPILPLIAVPTTAGTGSETTTVAVFDLEEQKVKTALRSRLLKPTLALVDPLNVMSMPRHVTIYSGFDVLCHALESYTAIPYTQRGPKPASPSLRPVYQGSNPISDVWATKTLDILKENFKRAVDDPDDLEARSHMLLASSFAGMGFGNAGVHLCHGLSYPISGQVKQFESPDYPKGVPLIPHGLSVVMTAPADFEFTAYACPDRHKTAANILGSNLTSDKPEDCGVALADQIREFMQYFRVPNGLQELGFTSGRDIDSLVKGASNSLSALNLAPRKQAETDLHDIYTKSLKSY